MLSLTSLFFSALISATLFPGGSEALLIALINEDNAVVLLVVVASIGNTIGSLINWWLGVKLETYHDRTWFPVSQRHLEKAKQHFHRYGEWSLLLSWLPVIGDPLTVAAGVLKTPFIRFLIYIAIAKTSRYIFVAYLAMKIT